MTIAEILAYPDACPVSDLALTVQRAGAPASVQSKGPQGGSFLRQDLTGADATGAVDVSLILEGIPPVAVGAALTIHAGKMHTYQGRRVVRCTSKNGGVTVSQNTLAPPPPRLPVPGLDPPLAAYVPPARLTRKRAAELAVTTVEDAAVMAGFAPDLTKLPPEVFQALTAVANTILIGVQRGDIGLEEGE